MVNIDFLVFGILHTVFVAEKHVYKLIKCIHFWKALFPVIEVGKQGAKSLKIMSSLAKMDAIILYFVSPG